MRQEQFACHPFISRRAVLRGLGVTLCLGVIPPTEARPATESRPVVETRYGRLRGSSNGGVVSFKGVPYGAPTDGKNRFLPARPPAAWSGIRDALSFGHQSPQLTELDLPAWVDPSPASEDCLVLNVFTPQSVRRRTHLPVMVWLHGGGFTIGSANSPLYQCHNLASAGDVVVVGVNHRLNLFGYTHFAKPSDERFETSGNLGQLDLVAALEWVRDNIEHFSGDPANVTIFGESGGGGKINALLGMPAAQGLFHKAIVQSGSILTVRDKAVAGDLTGQLFRNLGVRSGDIDTLQRIPVRVLLQGFKQLVDAVPSPDPAGGTLLVGPVADGTVIPTQPWQATAPSSASKVPMIIGTNLHESVAFIPQLSAPLPDDASLISKIAQSSVLFRAPDNKLPSLLRTYRRAMPNLSGADLLVRITTDIGFWRNALQQVDMKVQSAGSPTYFYECAWPTPCFGGAWAAHGVELPLLFSVRRYGTAWDGRDTDGQREAADPDNERSRVGAQIIAAWTSFARTGDPSTHQLRWPEYELATRPTMVFDRNSRVIADPRSQVRDAILAL